MVNTPKGANFVPPLFFETQETEEKKKVKSCQGCSGKGEITGNSSKEP